MGNTLRWCLRFANPTLARRHLGIFALCSHGADVANTVPNLFPTRARIEAGTGLIMGDGLTRAVANVGSRLQTRSPVIREFLGAHRLGFGSGSSDPVAPSSHHCSACLAFILNDAGGRFTP